MNIRQMLSGGTFRLLAGALVVAGITASPAIAQHVLASGTTQYTVTITDTSYAQGFSFPVVATHERGVYMWKTGLLSRQPTYTQASAMAQNGTPVPMFNYLSGLEASGAVTDVKVYPYPVASAGGAATSFWPAGAPTFPNENATAVPNPSKIAPLSNSVTLSISANRGDVLSVGGMLMCTNAGLAGIHGVALPKAGESRTYKIFAYDSGVEQDNWYTPDIVDPCAWMAPTNGFNVSSSDGNLNAPPTGTDAALANNAPLHVWAGARPTGTDGSNGYIPAAFGWVSPVVGMVTITAPNS